MLGKKLMSSFVTAARWDNLMTAFLILSGYLGPQTSNMNVTHLKMSFNYIEIIQFIMIVKIYIIYPLISFIIIKTQQKGFCFQTAMSKSIFFLLIQCYSLQYLIKDHKMIPVVRFIVKIHVMLFRFRCNWQDVF